MLLGTKTGLNRLRLFKQERFLRALASIKEADHIHGAFGNEQAWDPLMTSQTIFTLVGSLPFQLAGRSSRAMSSVTYRTAATPGYAILNAILVSLLATNFDKGSITKMQVLVRKGRGFESQRQQIIFSQNLCLIVLVRTS